MKSKKMLGLADDHALFRKGLISLLNEDKDLNVIIEVSNGKELLEALKLKQPNTLSLTICQSYTF